MLWQAVMFFFIALAPLRKSVQVRVKGRADMRSSVKWILCYTIDHMH